MESVVFRSSYPQILRFLTLLEEIADTLMKPSWGLHLRKDLTLKMISELLMLTEQVLEKVRSQAPIRECEKLKEMTRDVVKLRLTILSPIFLLDNTCQTPLHFCKRIAAALGDVQA